jgi:hypothetical protein
MYEHDDEDSDESSASLVTVVATALACGLAVSLAAAAPAILRARSAGVSQGLVQSWVVMAALGLIPATLLVCAFRALRTDKVLTSAEGPLRIGSWCLTLGLTLSLNVMLGAVLRKSTHHMGLAGATYAVTGAVFFLFSMLAARRLRKYFARTSESAQRSYALTCAVALSITVALCFVRISRAESLSITYGAGLTDAVIVLALAFFAAQTKLRTARILTLIGPPLAALTIGIGLWTTRPSLAGNAEATSTALGHAPLHAYLTNALHSP